MTASVAHWQILTADPDRIAAFYGDLFGWPVSAANGMGYREIGSAGNGGISGGIWPVPPGAPEAVQVYVAVDDIDASLESVRRLGGSVLMEKQLLPDGDAMALALDPLGRSFGLMTAGARA
jgi:predicted enzyme related to lactoylglutathione lyase